MPNRVRETRHAAGLTLADVAAITGLDPATLWRIETGRTLPHTATLGLLALALDVEPTDLVQLPQDRDRGE